MSEFFTPIPEGYVLGNTKYVVVFGTVMSGLGKGIFASSLASVLKSRGISISPIKLEGYLNKDSGTLSPYRHGEVFVLDDGMECDMDLGTYERMLDVNLSRSNFVTSGQILASVLEKERKGEYLGHDVQVIPHVTGEVKLRLRELSLQTKADIIFVEVGGTVGDVENTYLIEAIRQMSHEEGIDNFCFVALTYIPEPKILGEQKSKPAQLNLKLLNAAGIQPHILGCRASSPVTDQIREKLALFTNVPLSRIFSMHDSPSIYDVPNMLEDSGIVDEVLSLFKLQSDSLGNPTEYTHRNKDAFWNRYLQGLEDRTGSPLNIGIIGKYTSVRDSYASIIQAIEHCSSHFNVHIHINWIESDEFLECPELYDSSVSDEGVNLGIFDNIDGIIVPGGFGTRGTEGKLECIRYAREKKIPFLGICYGMQLAAIEFARNVVGLTDANSTEIDPKCSHKIVDLLPSQSKLLDTGGTMRLGGQDVVVRKDSIAGQAIGWNHDFSFDHAARFRMRFRHRFEINAHYIPVLEEHGMIFSGWNVEDGVVEILELPRKSHPFFVATQSHPEFLSRPMKPEPLFLSFISAAINVGKKT